MNKFQELNKVNVTKDVSKKGKFDYLSWADAWKHLQTTAPGATYKVYENQEGLPFFKSEEGYIVKVSVTIDGLEHISYLPVMDMQNKAKKSADMMDINKTIQRAMVKAIALHGLGLAVYTGEDLPEEVSSQSSALLSRPSVGLASSVAGALNRPVNTPPQGIATLDSKSQIPSNLIPTSYSAKVPYGNDELKQKVKDLGFRWDADSKTWVLKSTDSNLTFDFPVEKK